MEYIKATLGKILILFRITLIYIKFKFYFDRVVNTFIQYITDFS